MIQVISLLGRAGSGKTTVANHLKTKYGAKIVSLAAPLKKIAKAVMDFSDAQLYGSQEDKEAVDPRYGMSARLFLQRLGTEGIRTHLGGDVWLQALVYNIIEEHKNSNGFETVFVVDDARFINEIDFIQNLKNRPALGSSHGEPKFFGSVLKLVCTDAPPSGNDNHPSERQIDLVLPSMIDGVAISSRAQGMDHLIETVENLLDGAHLRNVRKALQEQLRATKERAFQARRAEEAAEGAARQAA